MKAFRKWLEGPGAALLGVAFVACGLWFAWSAIESGVVAGRTPVFRDNEPFMFWFKVVGLMMPAVMLVALAAIAAALRPGRHRQPPSFDRDVRFDPPIDQARRRDQDNRDIG